VPRVWQVGDSFFPPKLILQADVPVDLSLVCQPDAMFFMRR